MYPHRLYGALPRVIATALFLLAILVACFMSHAHAAGRHHHHIARHHHGRVYHAHRHHVTFGDFERGLAAAKPVINSPPETLISIFGRLVSVPGSGTGLFWDASSGLDLGFNSTRDVVGKARDYVAEITIAAREHGMNPVMPVHVCMTEGCKNYVGDGHTSFGPFQLHYAPRWHRPALGDKFTAETGLDARDPRTVPEQIDFVLDYVRDHPNAWRTDWFGWQHAAWHRHHVWRVAWRGRHHRHRHWANVGGGTAVYDIAAHTVILPDGRHLDAHSGFGRAFDDPRYAAARRRGPTPPGVYVLAERGWFHGVYALAMIPVAARTYGRSGLLVHSCMLGGSCQSFGCISCPDYPQILDAYRSGEVRRIEVVAGI